MSTIKRLIIVSRKPLPNSSGKGFLLDFEKESWYNSYYLEHANPF